MKNEARVILRLTVFNNILSLKMNLNEEIKSKCKSERYRDRVRVSTVTECQRSNR